MAEIIVPLIIVLIGMGCMAIYVLGVCLRNVVNRLADISEKLMVIAGTKDGNDATGRALVALNRQPSGGPPGIATKSKQDSSQLKKAIVPKKTITIGSI